MAKYGSSSDIVAIGTSWPQPAFTREPSTFTDDASLHNKRAAALGVRLFGRPGAAIHHWQTRIFELERKTGPLVGHPRLCQSMTNAGGYAQTRMGCPPSGRHIDPDVLQA